MDPAGEEPELSQPMTGVATRYVLHAVHPSRCEGALR